MNPWAAIALSLVTLVAAVALFLSGNMWPAAIALMVSVACDVVYVLALRSERRQRKSL